MALTGGGAARAAAVMGSSQDAEDLLRMLVGEQTISNPGTAMALDTTHLQLFYPDWLEGTWQVSARFDGASFPQGQRFIGRTVPGALKGSLIAVLADVGAAMERTVTFQQRFQRSAGEGGVVADRPFNIQQQVDAMLGYAAVRDVTYNPLKNATRLSVVWATPRKDTSSISEDLRKAELFCNNRRNGYLQRPAAAAAAAGGEQPANETFLAMEFFRQVTQAVRQGFVGDYEVISRLTRRDATHVDVKQRVAAFLQPQDALFFEARNAPVALYDYLYTYERVPQAVDAAAAAPATAELPL